MYYLIDKKTGAKICRTKHRDDLVEIIENTIYEHYEIILVTEPWHDL